MSRYIAAVLFVMVTILGPVTAQVLVFPTNNEMTEQQELDEISALRYYSELLGSIETSKYITSSARGNARPSDWAQSGLEVEGSGKLLREVGETLRLLGTADELHNPKWIERWESLNKVTGGIRKVAAAINFAAEFIDAVSRSETSTAEEKLKAMAEVIRNINTLVPVDTPVTVYVGKLADGIEAIARDAAIIESVTQQKNDIIDMVDRLLVGESKDEPASDDLQDVISEIEARIEQIEREAARRVSDEAYRKLEEAEEACANAQNTSRQNVLDRRFELGKFKRELQNIEVTRKANDALIDSLRMQIESHNTGILDARIDLVGQNPEKALAALKRISRLEHENRDKSSASLLGSTSPSSISPIV